MFSKLQLKMTLYFSMILVTILFVTNFVVYFVMIQYNQHQLSTEVTTLLTEIENQTWEYPSNIINLEAKDLEEPTLLRSFSVYIVFSNEDEIVNFHTDERSVWESVRDLSTQVMLSSDPQIIRIKSTTEFYYLVAKRPIIVNNKQLGYYFVGKNITVVYETLDNLRLILMVSLLGGSLLSVVIGYFIAGSNLKPIKKAYEAKQAFLANASHELRTPLSVIMLSTNTLEAEISLDEPFQQEIVADIKEVTKKMNGLIENLLLLSRSDTNKLATTMVRFDFSELVKNELESFTPLFTHRNLTLESKIQDNVSMEGDEKLLRSMVSIFVDNAIKYTHDFGKVRVELYQEKVYSKQIITFKVQDTGIGIPEKEVEHIFERFYRVENSRSKKTGGYGLGLSIAKEIIDLHHGSIDVKSKVDQGTLFTVVFKEK